MIWLDLFESVDYELRVICLVLQTAFSHKDQPKLLAQFQYCESTGIPLAVIIGDGELKRGVVKLRRMDTRVEQEVPRSELPAAIERELALLRHA